MARLSRVAWPDGEPSALGAVGSARAAWLRALAIYTELRVPQAAEVRDLLAGL